MTYTTTIEVGNYKQRPVRIAIHDVLPKSGREEIKIDRGKLQPAPVKGPDEDGVIRWELDLPPGQTQTITFTYTIRRPEHWLLQQ